MGESEHIFGDDIEILNHLLQTVTGLRPVSTGEDADLLTEIDPSIS